MLAHAHDIVSHVLVRGRCALILALTELLHYSEMCFLGRSQCGAIRTDVVELLDALDEAEAEIEQLQMLHNM